MPEKIVGVECDGRIEWHIPGVGNSDYATFCGLDGDDPTIGQTGIIDAPRGTKIDCMQCNTIWRGLRALKLRDSDFA